MKARPLFLTTFLLSAAALLLLAACAPTVGPPTVDPGRDMPPTEPAAELPATDVPPTATATPTPWPTLSYTPATREPTPTSLPPEERPTFTNHPAPPGVPLDFTPFLERGCSEGNERSRSCEPGDPLYELGCDWVTPPNSLLGYLDPQVPLAWCGADDYMMTPEQEAIWAEGGVMRAYQGLDLYLQRFVIFRDGKFQLIRSPEEFQAFFAPIESAEEALSYALAVTYNEARYNMQYDPWWEYEVAVVEDSYVSPVDDGYQLLLYYQRATGCGPFPYYAVPVHVTFDGTVTEGERLNSFRDTRDDNLCAD